MHPSLPLEIGLSAVPSQTAMASAVYSVRLFCGNSDDLSTIVEPGIYLLSVLNNT